MDKYCGQCGNLLDQQTGLCPNCNKQNIIYGQNQFTDVGVFNSTLNKKSKIKLPIIIVVFLLLIFLLGFIGFKSGIFKIKSTNANAIDYKSRTTTSYDSDRNVTSTYYYEYDKKGNNIYSKSQYYDSSYEAEYKYDKNNRLIESISYSKDSFNDHYINEYDKNNEVILVTHYDKDGNETDVYEYEKQYNKNKQLKSIKAYLNGELFSETKIKYDDNERLIFRESTNSKGKVSRRYEAEYDKKGHLIEENYYSETDEYMSYRIEREYNKKGELIESTRYDSSGNKESTSYYEKGKTIKEEIFVSEKLSSYTVNEYDKKGNQILSTRYDSNDKNNGYTEREYDKKNRIISYYSYDSNGDLSAYGISEYEDW